MFIFRPVSFIGTYILHIKLTPSAWTSTWFRSFNSSPSYL